MKTLKSNSVNEIIIKNSRFITLLYKLNDINEVNSIVDEVKELYPKATHYCSAYITDNARRSSDDGEPGGTAGAPMLNVLDKEEIINVLAVTVRYFGGIKLGAGGLVRAYSKSVRDAIIASDLVDVVKGYRMNITISYDMQKNLDYLLKNYVVVNKQFNDKVIYTILLPMDKLSILGGYNYEILSEEYIEKVEV